MCVCACVHVTAGSVIYHLAETSQPSGRAPEWLRDLFLCHKREVSL